MTPSPAVREVRVTLVGAALDAPLTGHLLRWPLTLHAVTMAEVVKGWRRGTFWSACGRRGLRLVGGEGLTGIPLAALWPPRLAGLAPWRRCRACWLATGRPRPRSSRVVSPTKECA